MPRDTARLLEVWREAERAASAARIAAERAREAAEAAAAAAEAARIAAEDAGITLEVADTVAGSARNAYHAHAHEVAVEQAEATSRPPIVVTSD
jgi:hypothetical protein